MHIDFVVIRELVAKSCCCPRVGCQKLLLAESWLPKAVVFHLFEKKTKRKIVEVYDFIQRTHYSSSSNTRMRCYYHFILLLLFFCNTFYLPENISDAKQTSSPETYLIRKKNAIKL